MDELPPVVWNDVLTDALLSRHQRAHSSPALPPALHSDVIADAVTWDRTRHLAHQLTHAFEHEEGLHGEPMAAARERYASLTSHRGNPERDAGEQSALATDDQLLGRNGLRDRQTRSNDWHLDRAAGRELE